MDVRATGEGTHESDRLDGMPLFGKTQMMTIRVCEMYFN